MRISMKLLFLVSFLVLTGCSQLDGDSRLDGTWTSNKALTLKNLGEGIFSNKERGFIENNLGDMQYIHRGGKVAVSFLSAPIKPLQFSGYKVFESDVNSVTLGHANSEKIKMVFYKNCIFHKTEWGFDEYFCKTE